MDRLTSWIGSNSQAYAYDLDGNRTSSLRRQYHTYIYPATSNHRR
jgi:hypothetical protein